MKIFYAQLSDGSTVKRKADRIEIVNESLRVWVGSELVAYLDLGAVLYAHIYEGRPTDGRTNPAETIGFSDQSGLASAT